MSSVRSIGEKAVSLVLLVILFPLIVLAILAIYLESGGPILFRQTRVGHNREPFVLYKFRTMHLGSESHHKKLLNTQLAAGEGFLLHIREDKRTTSVGKVLRRLSIDEIPNFLNVLNGTMSLVGPRPMIEEEAKHLTVEQLRRFSVLPGLTGLAQVNGRSSLPAEEYVAKDLELIRNYSVWLYWRILLATPLVVISQRGAV